jgi:cation transport regulator ChaC
VDWLFAYGSLLASGGPELPAAVVACSLVGWQRTWGVAMDNSVDLPGYKHYLSADGTRPAVMVAFLDISPAPDFRTNGIAVPVEPSELPGLDARERNYERVEVTGELDRDLAGRVWTYRGRAAARERAARGDAEDRLVVARAYRDGVVAALAQLGQRGRFETSTGACPPVVELEVVHAVPPPSPRALTGLGE